MTIKKLDYCDFLVFDRESLPQYEPYFALDYITATEQQRQQWFENLLTLARHNLSLAHCVHHNHYARTVIQSAMNTNKDIVVNVAYTQSIFSISNVKSADTMMLSGLKISGTKHWLSMLDISDYCVIYCKALDQSPGTEAMILLDLATVPHHVTYDHMIPIGMEIARPGSITVDDVLIPHTHLLGFRHYFDAEQIYPLTNNFANYCFITNYLGLLMGLYNELAEYMTKNQIATDADYKKLGLSISNLYMVWQDHLPTINTALSTDQDWHRRNTQYVMSKNILLDLINYILKTCDSSWVSLHPKSQRFRDALTFCAHMRPLQRNLNELNFVKF
jgi:hypothetical protein